MSNNNVYFQNRIDAGKKLAALLSRYQGKDVVVYALPRGGVIVGKEIAKVLNTPLDLLLVHKIGHPYNPEFAIGAISESGRFVSHDLTGENIDPEWLEDETERQKEEIKRRRNLYLRGRSQIKAKDKTAIIVDDGVATGSTLLAAIDEIKHQNPKEIIVAVPVIPKDIAETVSGEIDHLISPSQPEFFLGAVGAYYNSFDQVSDEEVIKALDDDTETFLYNMPSFLGLAELIHTPLPEISHAQYNYFHFSNREIQITLTDEITDKVCYALGTIAPPDEQLIEMLLLCHTLKKEGARRVIALIPYLAYMRQDKNEYLKSLAAAWIGKIVASSGIDEIITIDIHSQLAKDFFDIPVHSLSSAQLFGPVLRENGYEEATLVAPDEGAIHRAEALRDILGKSNTISYFQKMPGSIRTTFNLQGEVSRKVILVDDVLDTGNTLLQCCDALRKEGVEHIAVVVTHGLFSGNIWPALFENGVEKIFTTDTIPTAKLKNPDKISTVSVAPLLREFIESAKH